MLLPNKVLDVHNSLIYKALDYYSNISEDKLVVNSYEEIEYLSILYGLGYIRCVVQSGFGGKDEIKIFKNK